MSRLYLLTLTFWTGALTLAIEVFAFRSMALIVSSSILVTSVVIALVIIALSFGYYLSIRVKPEQRIDRMRTGLLITTCLLPVMALVAPVTTGWLGPFIYSSGHMVAMGVGGLLALLILTVPLPLFLGYVSPLLFSCLREHYATDQETAARSFIASGVGSLSGSIFPNLLLIPWIGMVNSYLLLTLCSVLLVAGLMIPSKKTLWFGFLAGVITLWAIIALTIDGLRFRQYLAVEETPYQTIHVWKNPHDDVITMGFNAQIGSQSYLDRRLLYRKRSYFDNVLLFLLRDYPEEKNVLMLGSAGATISTLANTFLRQHIDMQFTNVDIDPVVHDLAKQWFAAGADNIRFVADDARAFIQSDNATYDLVILDVYVNELFIPATLYSVEFFQLVDQRMQANSVITMNVNAKGAHSPVIQAGLGTLGKVFDYVYITTNINEGVTFAPILITASHTPIDFQAMANANPIFPLKKELGKMPGLTKRVDTTNLPFIQDDSAMTEYLALTTFLQP